MARYALAGEAIEITFDGPVSGLVGTLGMTIQDGQGSVLVLRSTLGFVENAPGIYTWTGVVSEGSGTFLAVVDDGTNTPAGTTAEMVIVTGTGLQPFASLNILEHARSHFPETYDVLENENPGIAVLKLGAVLSLKLNPGVDPDTDISEFARGYLGAMLARELIEPGMDHWAVLTKMNKHLGRPSGVTLGGETAVNYDRVVMLEKLAKRLDAWLALHLMEFEDDVGEDGNTSPKGVIRIWGGNRFKTIPPGSMPAIIDRGIRYDRTYPVVLE